MTIPPELEPLLTLGKVTAEYFSGQTPTPAGQEGIVFTIHCKDLTKASAFISALGAAERAAAALEAAKKAAAAAAAAPSTSDDEEPAPPTPAPIKVETVPDEW